MKKFLRLLALTLAVLMCFTYTACKKNPTDLSSDVSDGGSVDVDVDANVNVNTDGGDKTQSDSGNQSSNQQTGNVSSSGQSNTNKVDKNNLDFGGKTITIIYEYQPSNEKGIDPSRDRELDRIAELNKKFNVNIVMKKGASNYNEAIVSSISAGTPIGNIIRINGNKNYDFIKAGLCATLNDAMASTGIDMTSAQYDQRTNKYYNVNGKQYTIASIIPQESDVYDLWFYNKDILAELGYGADYIQNLYKNGKWTWDEAEKLFAAANKQSANGTVTRYALGCAYAFRTVTSMVLSNNGKIGSVDKTGAPVANLGSANVREAMQRMYDWGAVKKYISPTESDETYSKFNKGEIFMCSTQAGQAKKFHSSGVNFGVIYPPKGPNGTKNVAQVKVGGCFMIPVTYQSEADKYLLLLDALYAPYEDATREEILKNDAINYFSDVDSWNIYKDSALNESVRVNDDFTVFNLEWANPAFGTVCNSLIKGNVTPGSVVEKYNDQYQALLDDLFKGYKLTGVK